MERIAVSSRNVVSVGYEPDSCTLEVEFRSGTYQYFNVPPEIYNSLLEAGSKGSFVDQYIRKGGYPYAKVS
jgi:hypothetical protein